MMCQLINVYTMHSMVLTYVYVHVRVMRSFWVTLNLHFYHNYGCLFALEDSVTRLEMVGGSMTSSTLCMFRQAILGSQQASASCFLVSVATSLLSYKQ